MPITRPVCAKVNEYLTLTGYVHQGVDLWKQSEIFAEHYRGNCVYLHMYNEVGLVFLKLVCDSSFSNDHTNTCITLNKIFYCHMNAI